MLYCGLYFAGIVVVGKVRVVAKASTMVRGEKTEMEADTRVTAKKERDG